MIWFIYSAILVHNILIFICKIGTKIDLRDDRETLSALAEQGLSPLKREQGQKLANKVRAVKYMECSALTQRGLKQVCFFPFLWPPFFLLPFLQTKLFYYTTKGFRRGRSSCAQAWTTKTTPTQMCCNVNFDVPNM